MAGIKSSTGKITPPEAYRGVSLKDLVEAYGGINESMGINIVAEDGYAITYSYDQLMNGNFIAYDPATGEELRSAVELDAILAYERNGEPLDEKEDGVLRLVIISPTNNQVTDGHWSVKWVAAVEIKSLVQDWKLELEGAIEASIDRASYESCVNCHKATWKDDKAQEWVGVPLWLLAGYADDEIKHEGPAFNDDVAQAAYLFELITADGYSISLESTRFTRDNNFIIANLVNGNQLPDQYFPLRLVGSAVEKNEQIGQITQVKLHLEDVTLPTPETITPTESVSAVPPGEGDLVIYGMVENPLVLNEEDIGAMEVVDFTAEHPKKGNETYQGVRLSNLFDQAMITGAAQSVVFTASDGYASEISLSDVQGCADCLLAFTETAGKFKLVMPGFPSDAWVKDIAQIEIK